MDGSSTCGRATCGRPTKSIAFSKNLRLARRSRKRAKMGNRIQLSDMGREPFRIFFPAGVLSGIVGVSLWPLYFLKLTSLYPGQSHARIMAYGLFGGFIF